MRQTPWASQAQKRPTPGRRRNHHTVTNAVPINQSSTRAEKIKHPLLDALFVSTLPGQAETGIKRDPPSYELSGSPVTWRSKCPFNLLVPILTRSQPLSRLVRHSDWNLALEKCSWGMFFSVWP